ncbi:histone deacetylase HDT2 isoform X2 [Triticum aestivum]|uniref:histone deacetylase HDT2 isoform X2 n=1 Tax=Triticum aestivum TaxID=4565 RepID=UPI001D009D5E|nr:histone deacetylase HDT2-like isoform X2 [Triticum aestivum]
MKFWGVEVKPGQTVYCDPGEGRVVHLTQVALGETEKRSVGIPVSAKIGDQKGVIGTLSAENHPQILCDLIFEKQFELSHSSKTASVFACGYKIPKHNCTSDSSESDSSESDSSEFDSSESDSSEDEVETVNNQVANPIVGNVAKPPTTKDDKKVTDNHDSGEDDSDFYSTDSDDYDDDGYSSLDTDSEEDGTSSEEMDTSSKEEDKDSPKPEDGKKAVAETALKTPASDDTSSKEGSSDEEDKNTPKPEVGTKRAAETALETPAPDKKAKIETPSGQDTDDKKIVHVATPHPAKQADKAPGNSKQHLKSKYVGGAHACKSCSRTFGSASALQSHEKAKHA